MGQKSSTPSKQKKITVKFFINKAVLPTKSGRENRYPLYMLITYDRKNTMMRCHYGQYYKDLNEIEKVNYPGLLALEERIIKKTITYELAQRVNDFDLKGTNKKYDYYAVGIHLLLQNYLKNQLWSVLSRIEPFDYVKALNFKDGDVEFDTLFKIAKKLYKDLSLLLPKNFEKEVEVYNTFMKIYRGSFFEYSFPVVIEWLDHSVLEEFKRKLTETYSDNQAIKKHIEFIDNVVQSAIGTINLIV